MVSITAVGDIILTDRIEKKVPPGVREQIFEKVRPRFLDADINFCNLECPLSDRGVLEDQKKEFVFRASPDWARILKHTGFNTVCLANNHVFDYGPLAMLDTIRNLERWGISYVGAGRNLAEACRPLIREVRGIKIAFLAFTYAHWAKRNRTGCCPGDRGFMCRQIESVRRAADLVVVSIHDGLEYVDYPSREMMRLFRSAADAGANLVLGHHPHVVQGIEQYQGALLCYSLGNFVSDYSDEEVRRESYAKTAVSYFGARPLEVNDMRTTETFILHCELVPGKSPEFSLTPVRTGESFQLELMHDREAEASLNRIAQLSKQIIEPDERLLDQMDTMLQNCRTLGLKRLAVKDILVRAHRLRPHHLKMVIPFLKAKLS